MLCQEVVQVGCLVPGSDCLRKYIPRYKSLSDHLIHPSENLMAVILFKGNISVNPLSHKNRHCQINGSKQAATTPLTYIIQQTGSTKGSKYGNN